VGRSASAALSPRRLIGGTGGLDELLGPRYRLVIVSPKAKPCRKCRDGGVLAALFDRLGRVESAATIAGFAFSPLTATANPELTTAITDLRDVLGNHTYESLARRGGAMTTAVIVTYAYDQIDQARTGLEHRG
jgi:hypothetical protein